MIGLIRGIAVEATPEEVVRQGWLRLMVDELGYPKGLVAVEKELGPSRRADIIAYRKGHEGLEPLLLIECKAGALRDAHRRQVSGYNHHLGAPYIALVNEQECLLGVSGAGGYTFSSGLPTYEDLVSSTMSSPSTRTE